MITDNADPDPHRRLEVVAASLANLVSLDRIEQRYGDDAYGRADGCEDLPDLGENA